MKPSPLLLSVIGLGLVTHLVTAVESGGSAGNPETAARMINALGVDLLEVILHLPKFKLEPPLLKLGPALQSLGMRSAFDLPRGTANFERMAPRKPEDYLYLSEVYHKTFLAVDEKGTEAAAATAVDMLPGAAAAPRPEPVEFRVDHPFLFVIQHRPSGACLFLGRVTHPR